MRRYLSRLIFAFLISASCFAATHFWYEQVTRQTGRRSSSDPIARLSELTDEVQRKQLARVIWEEISLNEELFPGEAIRTSSSSQAKILFLETGTEIELEPDSLIVLEKNQDGIALDFLKGNLFVSKSKEGSGPSTASVKLKTGGNQISLNNAELSLSKTETGKVDLEVFSGTAKLEKDGKSTVLDQSKAGTLGDKGLEVDKNRLQVLSPLPGEPVYIDPAKREAVSYRWKAVAKNYDVFVERGKKRNTLYRNAKLTTTGDKGILKISTKVGRLFYRIVAIPKSPSLPQLASKTFPIEVKAKVPPVVLSPEPGDNIVLKADNKNLKVRWVARNDFDQLALEVATDRSLKTMILTEPLEATKTFAQVPFDKSGNFYLRLTGYMKIGDKLQPLSSPVIPFTAQMGVNLVPPKLKSPAPGQRLTYQQVVENGLFVSWDPVPGIQSYHLRIVDKNKKKVVDKEVLTNPLRLEELPPGNYRWAMRSNTDNKKASKFSEKRSFAIEAMPLIKWAGGPDPSQYGYVTKEPSLVTRWQQNVTGVKSWRVRIVPEGRLAKESDWNSSERPLLNTFLPQDGIYSVEVEGLGPKGKAIARSSKKLFKVAQKELLPPPQFSRDLPEILNASKRGNFDLKWEGVEGATRYKFQLLSEDGKQVLQEKVVQRTTASLNRMKPGNYKVSVKAVDEHQRDGESTRARALKVPMKSAIQAPTIKRIHVK